MKQKKVLNYNNINTKRKLVNLYLNQFSEKKIRQYIRAIIQDFRPNDVNCRNISVKEVSEFINIYGKPIGYEVSEFLKTE